MSQGNQIIDVCIYNISINKLKWMMELEYHHFLIVAITHEKKRQILCAPWYYTAQPIKNSCPHLHQKKKT